MQCPRGSECKESTHEVKTLEKAKEWHEGVTDKDLPITVQQFTASNGRVMVKVFASCGSMIKSKG